MKIVAAYLLAVLGGNTSPSAKDLKDILGSVGAEIDEERIELLLSNVKGKDVTELIASGREKLASVPSGGGAAVAVAAGGGGGGAAAPAPAEAKKEEKVEEKEESDDVSFLRFLELHFRQLKFSLLNILKIMPNDSPPYKTLNVCLKS
ncbi:60S acidic ribosomal protein P2-4-like isoform X1 [Cucumis melo]|uniref:60S acidic ribosomal protein P2-4-like isoform X1 n=1 Tax=Cucumis melo TaxID=3656 RepID=A0ABM3LAB7_CUCME|nr:60S acidic ribosomal protein P2-4-like isoform X1 [Cucumis melo]